MRLETMQDTAYFLQLITYNLKPNQLTGFSVIENILYWFISRS